MGEGLSHGGESYREKPRPQNEKLRGIGGLEVRLDAMALEHGHELDLATSERSAEWILFQRLMYLLIEESREWDPQQRSDLRKVIASLGTIAFSRFTEREQGNFLDNFTYLYEEDEGKVEIDSAQAGLVSRLGQRINIPFKPEPTTLTSPYRREEIRRITEIEDPIVTELLNNVPSEDKIGHILEHIGKLTHKQKVKLLLTLSDEEFEEFQKRRIAGFDKLAQDILSNPDVIPDKAERIKAISLLKYTAPRYEAEAYVRRGWRIYPFEWDKDLEEDNRFKPDDGLPRLRQGKRISYEEAIELARFENARKFYRNDYFPSVARLRNPLPICIDTIFEKFKEYKKELGSAKPGTDISMKDLLSVIRYYLDYEPDNKESCEIHQKVQRLVELIITTEEALGKE